MPIRLPYARAVNALACIAVSALVSMPAGAQTRDERLRVEQHGLRLSASPRAPDQTAAFYSARGFPAAAVEVLAAACLITFGIRNNRDEVVWLEPARWRFVDGQGRPVHRITREEWNARWQALDVPAASRSTFGWTQLPEQRDLRPGEPVGGNLALVPVAGPIRLQAHFHTGADRSGPDLLLEIADLKCPRGTETGQ